MHRRRRTAVIAAAAAMWLGAAAPASAGFGAVAYDQSTGRFGASFNQPTEAAALEQALKQCASAQCRVHAVEPKGCGALALSDKDKAGHIYWGGADRETLDSAKRDAVTHCQTHTTAGSCTVRISGCNQGASSAEATQPSAVPSATEIPLEVKGGVYRLPVRINDTLTLDFILDSGASDVSIPADVALTLLRSHTLTTSDFLGKKQYRLADGSTVPGTEIRLRELKAGQHLLKDVVASVGPASSDLLLGQSFLNRLGSIRIDNRRHVLVIQEE